MGKATTVKAFGKRLASASEHNRQTNGPRNWVRISQIVKFERQMCGVLALITGPPIQSEQSSQSPPEVEDSAQIECLPWRFGLSHFANALSSRGPDSTDAVNVILLCITQVEIDVD